VVALVMPVEDPALALALVIVGSYHQHLEWAFDYCAFYVREIPLGACPVVEDHRHSYHDLVEEVLRACAWAKRPSSCVVAQSLVNLQMMVPYLHLVLHFLVPFDEEALEDRHVSLMDPYLSHHIGDEAPSDGHGALKSRNRNLVVEAVEALMGHFL